MALDVSRLLREAFPDAFVVLSTSGQVLHWNKGAATLFGYDAAEVEGAPFFDLVVPAEHAATERSRLDEVLAGRHGRVEALRRRKDGSLAYVASSWTTASGGDDQVLVLASEMDITQLKVARDAELVEARYREVLDAMPDGIVMINATGCIVFSNVQADRMFGYADGELRGLPIERLLPARLRSGHVAHRTNYFSQPRTRAMGSGIELFGLRADGSEFPVEVSLSPLQTEGRVLVLSAIRDITERRLFERALREKNEALANANAAKDRFLASMSHELRTPLNAIIGFTGTLLMKLPGPLNDVQERQLRTVQGSGQHLLALINDLLDIAKIEAGKFDLVPEPVDCGAIVEEIAVALRIQAEGKGLKLAVALPGSPLIVDTDRRALSQIVINLLQNAIKFTEAGGVGVEVLRIPREGATPGRVEIRVSDTGSGIRAEDLDRLFAAFSRIVPRAGRAPEGTGLGLHLSQKLAERLGGAITVRSTHGEGSCFTLTLPEA